MGSISIMPYELLLAYLLAFYLIFLVHNCNWNRLAVRLMVSYFKKVIARLYWPWIYILKPLCSPNDKIPFASIYALCPFVYGTLNSLK